VTPRPTWRHRSAYSQQPSCTKVPLPLKDLADKDEKERINGRTVLLPPSVGGLEGGLLRGGAVAADDVADDWLDEQGAKRRERRWDDEPGPDGMRLILTVDTDPDGDEKEDAGEPPRRRFWRWYVRPRSSDDDPSRTATAAVLWDVHTRDVTERTKTIVGKLRLPQGVKDALVRAAERHDLGKRRPLWQKSIGNLNPQVLLAKAGATGAGRWAGPVDLGTDYRHEFGSLLDAFADHPGQGDLVLHLVAAHHGRGRPHFDLDEVFDPGYPRGVADEVAAEVPRRFARLQREFGRWGLAYLESLLRAADYAASAAPSATVEGDS
jgi:CRISPR-associated endonuclease/helicase Cas3